MKSRQAVSLRIQSECGKIPTRITPNTDTSYAVLAFLLFSERSSIIDVWEGPF